MTRRIALSLAAIAINVGTTWLLTADHDGPASSVGSTHAAEAAATEPTSLPPASGVVNAPRLELRIEAYSAGALDDIAVVARLSAARARQVETVIQASDAGWKGRADAVSDLPEALPPDGWFDRLQLVCVDGRILPISHRLRGPQESVRLVTPGLPPDTGLRATLIVDGLTIQSNDVVIQSPPSSPVDALVARGRTAEVLERWEKLSSIADELVQLDAGSAWGYYYRGLAARARGNATAARADFQRALDHSAEDELPAPLLRD